MRILCQAGASPLPSNVCLLELKEAGLRQGAFPRLFVACSCACTLLTRCQAGLHQAGLHQIFLELYRGLQPAARSCG